MKRLGIILLVIGVIAFLSVAFVTAKENKKDEMAEKQALAKAAKISLAEALTIATKQASGTVLTAELENENGKTIYSFDILPSADSKEVKEINVDAASGAIVASKEETSEDEAKEKDEEMKESKEKGEKMSKESKEKDSDDEEKEEQGEHGEKGKWEALKENVDITKLPAAVKSTVTKEAAGAKIESATTMPKIYAVKVKAGEESSELLITASGKLIEKEKISKEEDEEKGEAKEKEEKDEKDEKD